MDQQALDLFSARKGMGSFPLIAAFSFLCHALILSSSLWSLWPSSREKVFELPRVEVELGTFFDGGEVAGLKRQDVVEGEEIRVPKALLPQLTAHQKVEDEPKAAEESVEASLKAKPQPDAGQETVPAQSVARDKNLEKKEAYQTLRKKEALERLLKEEARKKQRFAKKITSPKVKESKAKRRSVRVKAASSPMVSLLLAEFSRKMQLSVGRYYALPEIYRYSKKNLRSAIMILLSEEGEIVSVRIDRSSGDASFDALSMRIVREAAPYPPPPEDIVGRQIVLHFAPFD